MPHYDKHYDQQLRKLKDDVLQLGGMVEEQVAKSIEALKEHNIDLASEVIDGDHKVNKLEVEIDEECIRILTLRQPQAQDLRFVTTAIKIIDNLERVGDLAANVCERVLELASEPKVKEYIDLPRMSDIARSMIKKSLDAFVNSDTALANEVRAEDDLVDAINNQIFRELLSYMMEDPKKVTSATRIMFISKYVERIADHATNVAEMVIYMVDGKIVRHTEPPELTPKQGV